MTITDCPLGVEARGWEILFCQADLGFKPQPTSAEKYKRQNGSALAHFLQKHGFKRVAEHIEEFLTLVREGTPSGRWYAEVYPTPAARALGVLDRYKFKEDERDRIGRCWPALIKVAEALKRHIDPTVLDMPSACPDRIKHKAFEDNVDGVVSLLVGMRLANVVRQPAALVAVGGFGAKAVEGTLFTPLCNADEQALLAAAPAVRDVEVRHLELGQTDVNTPVIKLPNGQFYTVPQAPSPNARINLCRHCGLPGPSPDAPNPQHQARGNPHPNICRNHSKLTPQAQQNAAIWRRRGWNPGQ